MSPTCTKIMLPCLPLLPPEIFDQITQAIPGNGHLLDLALCSRSICDFVLRHLYTHLTLKCNKVESSQPKYPKLRSLILRLLRNPILASHVRSIVLEEQWEWNWDKSRVLRPGAVSNHDFFPEVKRYLGAWEKGSRKAWARAIRATNEDATMALLFQIVTNVKAISIVIPTSAGRYFLKIFERAVQRQSVYGNPTQCFQNLETVVISVDSYDFGIEVDLLYYYMQLPSIRKICLQKVGSPDIDYRGLSPLGRLQPRSCQVQHLELRECRLKNQDLKDVLAACNSLQTFGK